MSHNLARLALGLAVCLTLALTLSPGRADEKANADEAMSESAEAVKARATAHDLIAWGRAQKVPEALVTAAIILQRTPAEEVKAEGSSKVDIDTPESLIKEAKELRGDDKALASLADEVIKEKARGSVKGVHYWTGNLKPGQISVLKRTYKAKETAIVGVNLLPPTPKFTGPRSALGTVRLTVTDVNNKVVATETAYGNVTVKFVPAKQADYTITILNAGKIDFKFSADTN